LVCAWLEGAANRTNGSNIVASLWGMGIPSLEKIAWSADSVAKTLQGANGQEGIRFEGLDEAGAAAMLLAV
jgi:hypothetical protein